MFPVFVTLSVVTVCCHFLSPTAGRSQGVKHSWVKHVQLGCIFKVLSYSISDYASWALRERASGWKNTPQFFQWKQQSMDSSLVLVIPFGDLYQQWKKQRLVKSVTSWNVLFFLRIKNMHHLLCDSFLDLPIWLSVLDPAGLVTLTSKLSMYLVLRSVTVVLILYCGQVWLPCKALSFLSYRLCLAVNYSKM